MCRRNLSGSQEMLGPIHHNGLTAQESSSSVRRFLRPLTSRLSPLISSAIDSQSGNMGGDRKRILIGLTVAMFLGLVVYMKLWSIDYSMSSDEAELLRRQFDLANREAMDESAEWRRMYDHELDRANRCNSDLNKLKESFEKVGDAARINQKLTKMQEENFALRAQVDALQQRLEAEKSRCGSQ